MLTRTPVSGLLIAALGFLMACSSATPITSPSSTASTEIPAAGRDVSPDQVVARFEVAIDPDSLDASLTPGRNNAGFQASQYDLDPPARFLDPDTLVIDSVAWNRWGDLEVRFIHRHPWDAPDISQPGSGTNRADLGYTGRLVALVDVASVEVPTQTFFGDVVANTRTIEGPDGFVRLPTGLSPKATGLTANTFPYMLLVDEAKNNRVGVSNGSELSGIGLFVIQEKGSYDPAIGGWQAPNLGPEGAGWTGYDFLHAGQSARQVLTLKREAVESGPVTFEVALLVHYTEPKGMRDVGLRVPPSAVDPLQFAYRLPHAALDVSQARQPQVHFWPFQRIFDPPSDVVQLEATANRYSRIGLFVRDWDVDATVSGSADLATDPDVSTVGAGSIGEPTVVVDCPGLGQTISLFRNWAWGSVGELEGSHPLGPAGSEMWFESNGLTSPVGLPVGARYPALARISDVAPSAALGLDPMTLAPSSTLTVQATTYQAFDIRVVPARPTWQTATLIPSTAQRVAVPDLLVATRGTSDPGDDRVFVVGYLEATQRLYLFTALNPLPLNPDDWALHSVDPANPNGEEAHLIEVPGGLALIYLAGATGDMMLARSTGPLPSMTEDWDRTVIEAGINPSPLNPNIPAYTLSMRADGGLSAAYRVDHGLPNLSWIRYAESSSTSPTGPGDWAHDYYPGDNPYVPQLRQVNGQLYTVVKVEYGSPEALAIIEPGGPVNWRIGGSPADAWDYIVGIGEYQQLPVALGMRSVAFAKIPLPLEIGDWRRVTASVEETWISNLVEHQGRPLILGGSVDVIDVEAVRALTPEPRRLHDWQSLNQMLSGQGQHSRMGLYLNRPIQAVVRELGPGSGEAPYTLQVLYTREPL